MRVAFNSPARNQVRRGGRCGRRAPLAPIVTVAEWFRRATVHRSTRVRFSPVTPVHAGVVQWIRIPGYEPGDLEVRILPPVPSLRSVDRLARYPAVYRV